jgi:hypothetical protein
MAYISDFDYNREEQQRKKEEKQKQEGKWAAETLLDILCEMQNLDLLDSFSSFVHNAKLKSWYKEKCAEMIRQEQKELKRKKRQRTIKNALAKLNSDEIEVLGINVKPLDSGS